jgi:small neutral amino acid transporter SnatA (MarC family)
MDALKAYAANFLGKVINEKALKRINTLLGIIFILLSFRLIFNGFQLMNDLNMGDVVRSFL